MKQKTSYLWTYFTEISSEQVKCNLCKRYCSRKGRGTTSLKNHLRSTHPVEHKKCIKIYEEIKKQNESEKNKQILRLKQQLEKQVNPENETCSPSISTKPESTNDDGSGEVTTTEENHIEVKSEPAYEIQSQLSPSRKVSRKKQKKMKLSDAVRKLAQLGKPTPEDQFDLFGKYIASQLRELPVPDALLCKENIASLLVQQRLNAIGAEIANLPNRFQLPKSSSD